MQAQGVGDSRDARLLKEPRLFAATLHAETGESVDEPEGAEIQRKAAAIIATEILAFTLLRSADVEQISDVDHDIREADIAASFSHHGVLHGGPVAARAVAIAVARPRVQARSCRAPSRGVMRGGQPPHHALDVWPAMRLKPGWAVPT